MRAGFARSRKRKAAPPLRDLTATELRRLNAEGSAAAFSYETKLTDDLHALFKRVGRDAARTFRRKALGHFAASLQAAGTPNWTPPPPGELIDVDRLVSLLRTKTDPVRLAAIKAAMTPLLEAQGLNFDANNPLVSAALVNAGSHVTNVAETTRLNIMRIVGASYDQGLSIPDTAKAIQIGMSGAATARAKMIARTELVRTVNAGSLASTQIVADATGTAYYKRWLTAPGAEYPRHELVEGLDGQTRPLDDFFDVSGDPLMYPGDPDGPPDNTINCRCALIYVNSPEEDIGNSALIDEPLSLERDIADAVPAEPDSEAVAALDSFLSVNATYIQNALRSGLIHESMIPELRAMDETIGNAVLNKSRATEDLLKPLQGLKFEYSTQGGVPAMPQTIRYLSADDAAGKRVALVTYRPSPEGIWLDGIAVAEGNQGEGIAKALIWKLHNDLGGDPVVHGSFSSLQGAKFGVGMSNRYPEWNKLWLGFKKDGSDIFWKPGDVITGKEETFDPMPYGQVPNLKVTITDALEQGATENIVALRAVAGPDFGEILTAKVGDTFYDPAYVEADVQTSRQFPSPVHGGFITYHLAPGQNGLNMRAVTTQALHGQLLLPRGLAFRVIGVGERDGLVNVHVEVIGRPVTPPVFGPIATVPLEPLTGDSAYALAAPVLRNAAEMESGVTAAVRAAVEPLGGVLEGLPFRIKSAPSVARKIEDIATKSKVPIQAASTGIKDSLRFTAVYEPDVYVQRMNETLATLRREGIVPEIVRPVWEKDVPYVGTNLIMRAPNGFRFELQFHTPQSFDVKEHINHPFYRLRRRAADGSPEAEKLDAKMIANANKVVHPPGIETWTYEPSVEGDIGISPFKEDTDNPIGFYDSEKFHNFENDVRGFAVQYGVTVDSEIRATGVGLWHEPAVALRVHDGQAGVRAYTAALGKKYIQEAVAVFNPQIGEDLIATLAPAAGTSFDEAAVNEAMGKAGLEAGRLVADGTVQIMGTGPEFAGQVDALARDLGVTRYDYHLGKFDLLEAKDGDYETALRDFEGAQGKPVRAPGVAVEEQRAVLPAGEGAPGAEAGAPQAVAGLAKPPQAALAVPETAAPAPAIPSFTAAEIKLMSTSRLWHELGYLGKLQNLARSEVADKEMQPLAEALWARGDKGLPKGTLRFSDIAGDQQTHTTYSDGHESIERMAAEASHRGEKQIVISDHSHLLSSQEIDEQFAEIDRLNKDYAEHGSDFKILKGIEANILADGSLDIAPEVAARFDVVNAAIHKGTQEAGQQVLFPHSNTERFLKAMDDPNLKVLVHPHSVDADWDAVAAKAAERGIALEINGRDLLRNGSDPAAAAMIAAAKRYGAKLVIGSDAHTARDMVDALYAVRFAARNGVTARDLVSSEVVSATVDESLSLPREGEISLSSPETERINEGMNRVYKTRIGNAEYAVKPEPDPEDLANMGIDTYNPLRETIEPGRDLERERAAYIFSRYFNAVEPDFFHVNVPPNVISGVVDENGSMTRSGVASWIPGRTANKIADTAPFSPWNEVIDREELRSAGLFDAIIGNTDRHAKNFLFDDDGKVWLIDHGLAFPDLPYSQEGFGNDVILHAAVSKLKDQLTPRENTFLSDLLDQWPQISEALSGMLTGDEIFLMEERIQGMLASGSRRPA